MLKIIGAKGKINNVDKFLEEINNFTEISYMFSSSY